MKNRRSALVAILTTTIGMLGYGRKLQAQDGSISKAGLGIYLDDMSEDAIVVSYKGESIKFTPKEIMDILRPAK